MEAPFAERGWSKGGLSREERVMILVYFIYGLAFYSLGTSILFYPKRGSEFSVAKTFLLVASFGIFHGIHEWVEMFLLLQRPAETAFLKPAGLLCLTASFLSLLLFGVKSLSPKNRSFPLIAVFPLGLLLTCVFITGASGRVYLMGDIWARYLLGVPGTLLTSWALFRQSPEFKKISPRVAVHTESAAVLFLLYGFLSGVVVPDAGFFPASWINTSWVVRHIEIPVQVFRAVCALGITYCFISMLSLFSWETNNKLRTLSLKDELTGLLNRRGFFTLAEQQRKVAQRQNKSMLLLIGDLDNLKGINDKWGHQEGDSTLKEISDVLRETFRRADVIARTGGDEFGIFQIESSADDLNASLSRLQDHLAERNAGNNRGYALSISVGSVRCEPDAPCSLDEMVLQADRRMYEQKKNKREHPVGLSNKIVDGM